MLSSQSRGAPAHPQLQPVIPANAGIHAEPAAWQRKPAEHPQPKHVIPANAGIHAEIAIPRRYGAPAAKARHPGERRDPC
jgi:hypothetical protein